MKHSRPTQADHIRQMLMEGWTSPLDAMRDLGCMRFSARVHEIKRNGSIPEGYELEERMTTTRNRFGGKVTFKEFRLRATADHPDFWKVKFDPDACSGTCRLCGGRTGAPEDACCDRCASNHTPANVHRHPQSFGIVDKGNGGRVE